jgi:hypothetical protein
MRWSDFQYRKLEKLGNPKLLYLPTKLHEVTKTENFLIPHLQPKHNFDFYFALVCL